MSGTAALRLALRRGASPVTVGLRGPEGTVVQALADLAPERVVAVIGPPGPGGEAINIKAAIASVVSGAFLYFTRDAGNPSYPGGEFTLNQAVVGLTVAAAWASGGTSKPGYTAFPGTVNIQNVTLTLALTGAAFALTASDSITIGSATITGSALLALGISGTGGTYTIPAALLAAGVQTAGASAVSVTLSTSVTPLIKTGAPLTTYRQPLFSKITTTGAVPSFTAADTHTTSDFAFGNSAVSPAAPFSYLWIAVPASASVFKYVFLGADNFITPSTTGTATLYGIAYNVYGFTGFGAPVSVIVVS